MLKSVKYLKHFILQPSADNPPAVASAAPKKVFVQRDYTHGTECQFEVEFPSQLEGLVRINMIFCF